MTKQELIQMTGSEEQATYAMEILLKNCKEAFVKMAIQAEIKAIDEEIKALKEEGIIYEANHSYSVDWGAPERVFGNEPGAYWSATDEQKAEAEALEERCREAEDLLSFFIEGTARLTCWQSDKTSSRYRHRETGQRMPFFS